MEASLNPERNGDNTRMEIGRDFPGTKWPMSRCRLYQRQENKSPELLRLSPIPSESYKYFILLPSNIHLLVFVRKNGNVPDLTLLLCCVGVSHNS